MRHLTRRPVDTPVQVYDLDTNIDVIKHHGSTDPLILVGILMHHGIAKEDVRT